MIDWGSLLLVAVVSLGAAVAIVTIASVGIRLLDSGTRAHAADAKTGRLALSASYLLFAVCGILVLFGVYLIIPALH